MTTSRLPIVPQSWYFVRPSRKLRRGEVTSYALGGRAIAIYRSERGRAVAMDARCPHMGAHLGRGRVVGEDLQCALHHWTCGPDGGCRPPAGACRLGHTTYPTVERYGSIFMFAGREARFDVPALTEGGAEDSPPRVIIAPPVRVRTSWPSLSTNAFDVEHMDAVHRRALVAPPGLRLIGGEGIEMTYVARVTGHGISDRIMRRIADDRVEATIECWGGTLVVVRSRAGRLRSQLMLCITPVDSGVSVTAIVARPRTGNPIVEHAMLRATRWLFLAFLSRDVEPLAGMDLRIDGALATPGPVGWAARWLLTLPAFGDADDRPRSDVKTSTRAAAEDSTAA